MTDFFGAVAELTNASQTATASGYAGEHLGHKDEHTLLLRLVGPMQSWGFRSRFDNRDTALEPTRSGVIGLLCAALGLGRNADLSRFNAVRMGVRVDAPGRVMVDYQTAQEVSRAGGGVAGTVQSRRYYLSDARFLIGLESRDAELLRAFDKALRAPVFPLFLGRKSYVPSLPVALPPTNEHPDGVRLNTGLVSALQGAPWRCVSLREKHKVEAARKRGEWKLRLLIETGNLSDAASGDVPLSFASRRFGLRYVREMAPLTDFALQEDELCFFRA